MTDLSLFVLQSVNDAQTGVIPVVAQAGTALAPLLALAVTNTIGLLLKPKELLRVLRAKPWILLVLLALGGGIWWLVAWMLAPPAESTAAKGRAAGAVASAAAADGTDWSKVALAIIRQNEEAAARAAKAAKAAGQPVEAAPPVIAAPPAPAGAAGSATFFRGGLTRSGHLGGPPPSALQPEWTYYVGDERNAMYLSSPLVRDGKVYAASCVLDPPNSYGSVSCLDLATGKELWVSNQLDAKNGKDFVPFFSSPALTADGSRLIIGQGLHTDFDSDLVCLDARTGAVLWTVHTPLHIESSPCIAGDLVVAGAGAVEVGDQHKPAGDPAGKGNPGFVLGVRISTGEVLFREPVNDPEGSPALLDGVCYVGSGLNGNRIVAFRTEAELKPGEKRLLWEQTTPFPATGAVTIAGELVLIGCGKGDFVFAAPDPQGLVLAYNRKTGRKVWEVSLPDNVLGAIAVSGDLAAVPCRNGEVFALDLARQGAVRWHATVSKQAPILAAPAIAGDRIYAVANDSYLAVFNATDGKMLGKPIYLNSTDKPGELGLSTSSPLIVDGRVVVGSETGGLRCLVGGQP